MCVNPPFIAAARASATHISPSRSQARDGGCPSAEHHANNPGSDHEGSGPHDYSHAVDITIDPPRFDPRDYLNRIVHDPFWRKYLKYIVTNWTGWHGMPRQEDMIWDFALGDTHWRDNGGYSHLEAPHTHFSFWPITEQITSPLFVFGGSTPVPFPVNPGHPEGDHMAIIQPVNVPPGKKPKLAGRTMGATLNAAARCVDLHNGAAVRGDVGTSDPYLRQLHCTQPGNPIGIGPSAPNRAGGPGFVVFYDNHITTDHFWS